MKPELRREATEILSCSDQPFWLPVRTNSMSPKIAAGEQVRVQPATAAQVRAGEVVAFWRDDQIVVHRLLAKFNGWLLSQGDSSLSCDPPWASNALIGKVVERRSLDGNSRPVKSTRLRSRWRYWRAAYGSEPLSRHWRHCTVKSVRLAGMDLVLVIPPFLRRAPIFNDQLAPWETTGGFEPWIVQFEQRQRGYRSSISPNYEIAIDLQPELGKLSMHSHRFSARCDLRQQRCLVSIQPSDARASIENFLRVLVAIGLSTKSGVLLHASGVVHQNEAVVFVGHSGAGKSTVAALGKRQGKLVLSDDLVAIRHVAGRWVVDGLPFCGSHPEAQCSFGVWPLRGIYFLNQSEHTKLQELSEAAATCSLAASMPFVSQNEQLVENQLQVLAELVKACRVRQLFFEPTNKLWDLV